MHKEILNKKMEEIGIQLSDMQTEQFLTYYDMLIERCLLYTSNGPFHQK